MDNTESLEEFYQKKFDHIPDKNKIGHFNLFPLEPLVEGMPDVFEKMIDR